jgi:hypothetical protein
VFAACALASPAALAVGESVNGFPNWAERVMLEWANRARSDPQYEMARCPGTNCGEKACYTPIAPIMWNERLNRAARFHSEQQLQQGYMAHDSQCTNVANIDAIYPATCNGAATCACSGGTKTCSPTCTTWSARVGLFGIGAGGEIIAGSTNPDAAFYGWLFEAFSGTQCAYVQGPPTNGHRWQLLKSTGQVGFGSGGGPSVGDFSSGGTIAKIPSGAHYPRQSASVAVWANYYDTAGGPTETLLVVDGACTPMTLQRGSATNGAYSATLTTVATGCHRYYFQFKDRAGAAVTYPTTGSLGIGPAGSCADWDTSRPALGAGCGVTGGGDAGAASDGGAGAGDGGGGSADASLPPPDSGGAQVPPGGGGGGGGTGGGGEEAPPEASGGPSGDPGAGGAPAGGAGQEGGCSASGANRGTGALAIATLACTIGLFRKRARRRA